MKKLLIVLMVLSACSGNHKPEKFDLSDAFFKSREFVRERLKSPSSVGFSSTYDKMSFAIDDSTFFIRNHFEAQNAFGVMVQNEYTCVITYHREAGTIDCENLKFIE